MPVLQNVNRRIYKTVIYFQNDKLKITENKNSFRIYYNGEYTFTKKGIIELSNLFDRCNKARGYFSNIGVIRVRVDKKCWTELFKIELSNILNNPEYCIDPYNKED